MDEKKRLQKINWEDIPKEHLNDKLDRRFITGDNIMLAQIYLKKGCIVPLHSHENEQMIYILDGEMRVWMESEESEPVILKSGDVFCIPSNTLHKAEAVLDTLDVDIFSPPRQDWIDKTDEYLK